MKKTSVKPSRPNETTLPRARATAHRFGRGLSDRELQVAVGGDSTGYLGNGEKTPYYS